MTTVKNIFLWVRDGLSVLRHCWAILLISFVSTLLSQNDQINDVMRNLSYFDWPQIILINLLLFLWSYITWYASRVLLYLTDLKDNSDDNKTIDSFEKWIPRILGLSPALIFILTMYTHGQSILANFNYLVSIAAYVLFVLFRKDIKKKRDPDKKFRVFNVIEIQSEKYPLRWIIEQTTIPFFLPLFLFIGFFVVFIISHYTLPVFMTPLGVIFAGLFCWTGFCMYLLVLEKRYRFPVFLASLLWVYFCSFFNNNHAIRASESTSLLDAKPTLSNDYRNWLSERSSDTSRRKKVILIAAEGGGIRSAYWTGMVLAYLREKIPAFHENIYCFSAVSGGTLGVSSYVGLAQDTSKTYIAQDIDTLLRNDFLSPLVSGMMFPNMAQWYWPFPIAPLDRARYLEYSWESAWAQTLPDISNIFQEPFSKSINENKNVPTLFYNGTYVEQGTPIITSNVSWNTEKWDIPDLLQIMNKDVNFSTATLLTARFPFVTPPGLIKHSADSSFGHVVDGGYFENSGLNTIYKVYTDIKPIDPNVDFMVISIKSGKKKIEDGVLGGAYELMAPFSGFMNAWDHRTFDEVIDFQRLDSLITDRGLFIEFDLPRGEKDTLPLGWYLSKASADKMKIEASKIVLDRLGVIEKFLY